MSTSYPGGIDNLSNPTGSDNLSTPAVLHSSQHTNANDAIEAIETELGTNPSGASASVAARFSTLDTTVANKSGIGHTHIETHSETYAIPGEIKVASGDDNFIIPFSIPVPAGQSTKLVGARYKINSGTSATISIKRYTGGTWSDIATGISVTTTLSGATYNTTLANNDMLTLEVTGVSGIPKNLSFTLYIQNTIS